MRTPKAKDRIEHDIFGRGTVKRVRRGVFGASVLVDFDLHGKKELCWGFAHVKCKPLKKGTKP